MSVQKLSVSTFLKKSISHVLFFDMYRRHYRRYYKTKYRRRYKRRATKITPNRLASYLINMGRREEKRQIGAAVSAEMNNYFAREYPTLGKYAQAAYARAHADDALFA